jgi:hypothetical protein
MKGTETGSAAKEEYSPPKILATYSRQDLEELLRRAGLHGSGGGCGCGTGSILEPWSGPGPDPRP